MIASLIRLRKRLAVTGLNSNNGRPTTAGGQITRLAKSARAARPTSIGVLNQMGQPLRLTKRRTPRRSLISRNFARLAANNRPSNRSPQSFSI
jgi:hypothetical protein